VLFKVTLPWIGPDALRDSRIGGPLMKNALGLHNTGSTLFVDFGDVF
jgi:hypothetical protein